MCSKEHVSDTCDWIRSGHISWSSDWNKYQGNSALAMGPVCHSRHLCLKGIHLFLPFETVHIKMYGGVGCSYHVVGSQMIWNKKGLSLIQCSCYEIGKPHRFLTFPHLCSNRLSALNLNERNCIVLLGTMHQKMERFVIFGVWVILRPIRHLARIFNLRENDKENRIWCKWYKSKQDEKDIGSGSRKNILISNSKKKNRNRDWGN